jgi:metallo-beta-lactamase class B
MQKYFSLLCFFSFFGMGYLNSQSDTIYASDNLILEKISPSTYRHISFLYADNYGKIACNGMLVIHNGEALLFDTPSYDSVSVELFDFLQNNLRVELKGVVVNHFHIDCLGGLKAFHDRKIPSYANNSTIEAAATAGYELPEVGFDSLLVLKVGGLDVKNLYAGPAHTLDNIYSFVESEGVLFGGCAVKSLHAGKGNLEDANVKAWPMTMQTILNRHEKSIKIVIPGHGKPGGKELLDFTAKMFGN